MSRGTLSPRMAASERCIDQYSRFLATLHSSILPQTADLHPTPLARHTRHSSGNMEHSHIWQAFWTHDSRVNLHISTDYDQRNGFGGLVTVLHGSSERSSSARGALQAFFCHHLGSSERRVPQLGEHNFLSEGRRRPCLDDQDTSMDGGESSYSMVVG